MNVRQLATRIQPGQETQLREQQQRRGSTLQRETHTDFAKHLEQAQRQTEPTGQIAKISNHAWQRIRQRGISMTEAEQRVLGEAMQQLDAKGSHDALLMRPDAAFVVNVPNRTVVTALGRHEMQQRIFTQIDSAMLV